MSIKNIIIRIALTILLIEAFIMQALELIPLQFTVHEETFIDAFLLVILSTPVIYVWIIKPYIIQNENALKQISHLMFYDELTNLPNMTKLLDWLDYSIKSSLNTNETVSLILFDLNRFKKVYDSFGHKIGDDIIFQIAQKFIGLTNNEVMLSRIGLCTFVLMVEHPQSNENVYQLAKKALKLLNGSISSGGHTFNLEASIGISSYPKDATNKEDLLKHAHTAMRHAKLNEDEQIHFYTDQLTESVQQHYTIEEEIRQALENNEFYLLYQPKIDARTNRLVGVEALIRWKHPEKGIIHPSDFIPIAEDSGLIIPIGEWVLQNAIQQQERWRNEGKQPIIMSINLSGRQLKETTVQSIINHLQTVSIPAVELEFEITETYIMKKPEEAQMLLEKLHKTGVSLAMDDFGTGYSSLGYLKRFQIDVLKIDKMLIDDLETNSSDFAIVQAIIAMAHALNIKVVAEGVETDGQVHMLRSAECDYFQGYYFSKPVEPDGIYTNQNYSI